jgi:hypothetical protein
MVSCQFLLCAPLSRVRHFSAAPSYPSNLPLPRGGAPQQCAIFCEMGQVRDPERRFPGIGGAAGVAAASPALTSRDDEEHQAAKACIAYLHRAHPGVATCRHDGGDNPYPRVRQREKEAGERVLGNTDACIGIWSRSKMHLTVDFNRRGAASSPRLRRRCTPSSSGRASRCSSSARSRSSSRSSRSTAPRRPRAMRKRPRRTRRRSRRSRPQRARRRGAAHAAAHAAGRPRQGPHRLHERRRGGAGRRRGGGAARAGRRRGGGAARAAAPPLPPAARTPPRTQPAGGDTVIERTSDGEEEAQRAQPVWQGGVWLPISWPEAIADGARRERRAASWGSARASSALTRMM